MKLDMCTEQSLDPDPTIPPISSGLSSVSRQVCELKGDPVCGCTVNRFHSVGGVGVEGGGKVALLVTETVLGGWV